MTSEGIPSLQAASAMPLWRQMADSLRARINSGLLAPGQRLPAEAGLGAMYRVSRITVRKAVEALVAEDLIVRTQGKGTFVAGRKVRHDLSGLAGIIDCISATGAAPQTRLERFERRRPPPAIAAALAAGEAALLHLRRLYEMDGACFGLADVWMPGDIAATAREADQMPAYAILHEFLGIQVARAEVSIRAQQAGRDVLRLLRLPRSATLLCFERTSFCAAGLPREHTRLWVRPESYEFSISVAGPLRISPAMRRAA